MDEKELSERTKHDLWFSNSKVSPDNLISTEPANGKSMANAWETTATLVDTINRTNKFDKIQTEDDDMKWTKRTFLFVNVLALMICSGLLINRASFCLGRYYLNHKYKNDKIIIAIFIYMLSKHK